MTLAGGATLAPGEGGPGTLTINGNLALAGGTTLAYEFGQSNAVGGPLNDLTQVGGDLTLDGTIDVTVSAGGSFGPGLYRVISYGGTLTDNGLSARRHACRQHRCGADLDRGAGQPGQRGRGHVQLLGRRGTCEREQQFRRWRQRHLAEQHRQ